ncbi:hypothetical protein WP1_110 [Pseudomonas phage WP1]
MDTVADPMKDKITLHGPGLHPGPASGRPPPDPWHPELPRRTCFHHSSIHDHRFDFESLVLAGSMENINYYADRSARL